MSEAFSAIMMTGALALPPKMLDRMAAPVMALMELAPLKTHPPGW
jgi:hypothetical protein